MVLEKKLAKEILTLLYEKGELSISGIVNETGGNWQTVIRRIEELRAEGLVYAEKSKKFPFERIVGLTKKGKEVALDLTRLKETPLGIGEKIILALLYALNNELRGSTKLEKFIYMLQRETNIKEIFSFFTYKHGPFSRDVLNSTHLLALTGLVEIEEKVWGITEDGYEKKLVIYRLTDRGKKIAEDIFNKLPRHIQEKLVGFNKDARKPLKEFLEEFYEKYPEFKKQTIFDMWIY